VARKIFRSPLNASSSARTLDARPTTNGVIMWGKITMSRIGIIGSRRTSPFKTVLDWFAMVLSVKRAIRCRRMQPADIASQ
jgi:hypothetical protein